MKWAKAARSAERRDERRRTPARLQRQHDGKDGLAAAEAHLALGRDGQKTVSPRAGSTGKRRDGEEEYPWLKKWSDLLKLIKEIEDRLASDNEHFRHSAMGDKRPRQFAQDCYSSHSPLFVAA